MTITRTLTVAPAVVLLTAGCAGRPAQPNSSSGSVSLTAPGNPRPLPGSTPPGTRLTYGEQAVITVGRAEDPVRLGVIVTGVDNAPEQDTAVLRASYPREVLGWAYVVRVVLVNQDGPDDLSGCGDPEVYGDLTDGGDAGGFQLLGETIQLPHCTVHSSLPASWRSPGARFDTCRILFADPVSVRVAVGSGGSVYRQ